MTHYRPEIDGLRTVAVVPVILFHAGVGVFSGGYVGVDVFFVISGYLITGILVEAIRSGKFSILDFYERRARRILPALFLVILVTTPFAFIWMRANQFEDYAQSIVAVLLFASNVLFWLEDGYFDFASEEKPLLHTWSLAVEEQYYIVFPILLLVLMRYGLRNTTRWIVLLGLVSFAACLLAAQIKPSANFYLAPFRAWELLAGSFCALLQKDGRGGRPNDILALTGLGMILAAIFLFDGDTPFPSAYTVLPVLGTVLVILHAGVGTRCKYLLSQPVMVGVGLISYSAYLWHQPLFVLARIRLQDDATLTVFLLLSLVSLALAYLSWRYVEQPFRRKEAVWFPGKLRIFAASGITAMALGAAALHIIIHDGYASRMDVYNVASYRWNNMELQQASWANLDAISTTRREPVGDPHDNTYWYKDDGREKLLLVGNSHSKDLYNALVASEKITARFDIARYGAEIHKLQAGHAFYNSPNYRASPYIVIATKYRSRDLDALPAFLDRIAADGKQAIVVSNTPEFSGGRGVTPADEIVQHHIRFKQSPDHASIETLVNTAYYTDFRNSERQRAVEVLNEKLRAIAQARNLPFLDRADYICDRSIRQCFALSGDTLAKHFYDEAHTTMEGARYFSERIDALDWFTF
jgi:peptidoglycan/LPS O-acetylase OafA/YrhL